MKSLPIKSNCFVIKNRWKIEFTGEKEQEVVDRLKEISLQNSQIE